MEEIKEKAPRRADGGWGVKHTADRVIEERERALGEEGIRYMSARRSESREKRRHTGAVETR